MAIVPRLALIGKCKLIKEQNCKIAALEEQ